MMWMKKVGNLAKDGERSVRKEEDLEMEKNEISELNNKIKLIEEVKIFMSKFIALIWRWMKTNLLWRKQ
jgi:hypothetical protein